MEEITGNVPKQVQDAAKAADAMLAKQALDNKKASKPVEPEAPAEPQDQNQTLPKVEDTVSVESLTKKLADAEQRYSVLQGKYNKEVKELGDDPQLLNTLKAENRELKRQNSDFSKIINDQQAEISKSKIKTTPTTGKDLETKTDENVISDEDLEHLANEGIEGKTLEIFKKLAENAAQGAAKSTFGNIETDIKDMKRVAAETRAKTFTEKLSELVPNWKAVNGPFHNANVAFLDWLDESAPYTNRQRSELLHEAQNNGDVVLVSQFFKDYLRDGGLLVDENGDPLSVDPKKETQKTENKLQINPKDMIEPGEGTGTGVPVTGKTYTMEEYNRHNMEFTKGLWAGRHEEWKARLDVLEKAMSEGRVRS